MRALLGFVTTTSVFLGLFNMLSGVVAGVWLAFLGEWTPIFIGVLSMFLSSFFLGLLMMPGLLFAGPLAYFANKGNTRIALFFGGLTSLYSILVTSIWSIGVMFYFLNLATESSLIPILIWSYCVALGPIQYMASKESSDSIATFITVYFLQIAYILGILGFIMFGFATNIEVIQLFGIVMLLSLSVQLVVAYQAIREESIYR